ncbi:Fic/DOC family protein [Pedobacter suwonensis]|uniref:Fic/DOC family protein n=1 Tax=Pedobacter suwonensis TaxID=332999 RepID=UPI0011A0D1BC|nr:Fic family protein [Pedobacter suwonensis]
MKYQIPNDQNEVLPNKLGLTSLTDINLSEFEGFLKAEIILSERLTPSTKFSVSYILGIHKLALSHLYSFAGKYRDVNISKGGFPFAAARFLNETMKQFEQEILKELPKKYIDRKQLISNIAKVHAELLLIHPFREGNGRTARILANLMCRKAGFSSLKFEKIGEDEFKNYVLAIQVATDGEYRLMEKMIDSIFPD